MKTLPVYAELRDYQALFMADVMQQLDEGNAHSWLYASPTGSGKSVMELTLLSYLPQAVLVTPRLEIVAGMLRAGGIDTAGWSTDKLAAEALQYRITTPIRLRNMLAAGSLPWRPDAIIWDEAHHRAADSYEDIRAYLPGVPEIGLTASPFRGTPKGTEEFLNSWHSLTWVLTYPDAAARGVIAVPRCSIWPLVDDDEVEVRNGELVIDQVESAALGVIDAVVERCRRFGRRNTMFHEALTPPTVWDRPTIFAVPTTATALALADALERAGLPARAVTQDTPRQDRGRIFAACERSSLAIVQIDVVSEGVDLKLRRLIDLRPTLSPVKWLQQVGRVTRPSNEPPEYICCNRNLERHCYLYEGLIPPAAVATAQQAFERPSARAGMRAVGTENLGRFAAAELPLADGTTGVMYQLTQVEGFTKREYAVLLHPCSSQPLYAARENGRTADGQVTWGKWRAVSGLPDMRGFGSAPAKALTDRQQEWWRKAAQDYGLSATGNVNRRNFAALPILKDLGVRLGGV